MSDNRNGGIPEVPASPEKESFISMCYDYLEIMVFSIVAVLLLFTLVGRLCRVDGDSMLTSFHDGETLITTSLTQPENGDVIVFHQTSDTYTRYNEPLVKRVIATEGQTVRIDYNTGKVYIDGEVIEDEHASLLNRSGQEIGRWTQAPSHNFNYQTGIFEATVPEGCLFVMGDNRNNSADSREVEIGFVDERRVLGTVILRLKPFAVYP